MIHKPHNGRHQDGLQIKRRRLMVDIPEIIIILFSIFFSVPVSSRPVDRPARNAKLDSVALHLGFDQILVVIVVR